MKTMRIRTTIIDEDLRKAGQTETIKRAGVKQASNRRQAGVKQAKANLQELLEMQKNGGDLEDPGKDYSE